MIRIITPRLRMETGSLGVGRHSGLSPHPPFGHLLPEEKGVVISLGAKLKSSNPVANTKKSA